MEVKAKATRAIVDVDGVPCRVWVATVLDGDQPGRNATLLVHRVALEGEDEAPGLTPTQSPSSLAAKLETLPVKEVQRRMSELADVAVSLLPAGTPFLIATAQADGKINTASNIPREELPEMLRGTAEAIQSRARAVADGTIN